MQVAGTRNVANEVAKVLVSNPAMLTAIGTHVMKTADTVVSQVSESEARAIQHSLPLSGSESLSSKNKTDRSQAHRKSPRKPRPRRKS